MFERDVAVFAGLLAAFLYCDLDKNFANFVATHWRALDQLSGDDVLILVPQVYRSSDITMLGVGGAAGLVRSFEGVTTLNRNEMVRSAARWLGVKLPEFPCIVFFDHPRSKEAYCFSFGTGASEEDYTDAIKRVLHAVQQVTAGVNLLDLDERQLQERRAEMIGRLAPRLRALKIFRVSRRVFTSRPMGYLARLAGSS